MTTVMVTTACIWSPQAHTNIYVHCTHVPAHVKEENTCVTSKSKGLPIKFPSRPVWGCMCVKAMTNMVELEMKIQRETVDENQCRSHRNQRRTPASGCVLLRANLI